MTNSDSQSRSGHYNCPNCEWMGDEPVKSAYNLDGYCPECGTGVNPDE